jgi:hypothetical protein
MVDNGHWFSLHSEVVALRPTRLFEAVKRELQSCVTAGFRNLQAIAPAGVYLPMDRRRHCGNDVGCWWGDWSPSQPNSAGETDFKLEVLCVQHQLSLDDTGFAAISNVRTVNRLAISSDACLADVRMAVENRADGSMSRTCAKPHSGMQRLTAAPSSIHVFLFLLRTLGWNPACRQVVH